MYRNINSKIRKQQRIKQKQDQKKRDRRNYFIFLIFAFYQILLYFFINNTVIGGNCNYYYFIVGLPTIIGLIISSSYFTFFKEVWQDIFENWKILYKVKNLCILIITFLSNIVFSFIVFTSLPSLVWYVTNYGVAKNNNEITVVSEITSSSPPASKTSAKIYFLFNSEIESVQCSKELEKSIRDFNKKKITLKVREGIWEHYYLENFIVE